MDRLDVALDVVVEQLDELGGVGAAGGVQEDLLQFADDQLLAEGRQHALGDDLLGLAAGDGGLGVVRAELGCVHAALAALDTELDGVQAAFGDDRAGQFEVGRGGDRTGEDVEVSRVDVAQQGFEHGGRGSLSGSAIGGRSDEVELRG